MGDSFNFDFDFNFDFEVEEGSEFEKEFEVFKKLFENQPYSFPEFCERYLKIQPKNGGSIPLVLNNDQRIWFDFLLQNYERNNKEYISFVTVKYRQNGISTVATAFCIYSMIYNKFNLAFTGANGKNTRNLYNIFNRFYQNAPFKEFGLLNTSKHKGLQFDILESSAHFLTAGGSDTTSLTIQGLLEDELGERQDSSDFEALAQVNNGFHLMLGTPKGTANRLYLSSIEFEKKDAVLFLAWYLVKGNEIIPHKEYEVSKDLEVYLKKYDLQYLSSEKKAWIDSKLDRIKLSSFDPITKLVQNYPPNLKAGFESTAENCFVNPYFLNLAFENRNVNASNDCILGVDVAGNGLKSDAFVMCIRLGNYVTFKELKVSPDDYSAFYNRAIQIVTFLQKNNHFTFNMINVDAGGMGTEFLKILRGVLENNNILVKVNPIFFNERVDVNLGGYKNVKRIGMKEFMYFNLRKWLSTANVFIEHVGEIKKELLATQIYTKNGEEFLLSKEEIKNKLGGHSPDFADALALTFSKDKDNFSIEIEYKDMPE